MREAAVTGSKGEEKAEVNVWGRRVCGTVCCGITGSLGLDLWKLELTCRAQSPEAGVGQYGILNGGFRRSHSPAGAIRQSLARKQTRYSRESNEGKGTKLEAVPLALESCVIAALLPRLPALKGGSKPGSGPGRSKVTGLVLTEPAPRQSLAVASAELPINNKSHTFTNNSLLLLFPHPPARYHPSVCNSKLHFAVLRVRRHPRLSYHPLTSFVSKESANHSILSSLRNPSAFFHCTPPSNHPNRLSPSTSEIALAPTALVALTNT
ncbi:hypothetical protein CC78DRAFT_582712 [Lojkania enalia]|uniref:Uncharacterized protein n=1 Tax=Lojkania enalia TaxID=147567 RepID=A0A9P4N4U3_9PLEO|nr:hypothetical protein CC78DRAFT_582712 [Didymosphaeria enalia]